MLPKMLRRDEEEGRDRRAGESAPETFELPAAIREIAGRRGRVLGWVAAAVKYDRFGVAEAEENRGDNAPEDHRSR
jgi:hypothetical protein